jgi:hypothetical protein
LAAATERRHRWSLIRRKGRICDISGVRFVPKRGDAVHCSPACKQKAYRQRRPAWPTAWLWARRSAINLVFVRLVAAVIALAALFAALHYWPFGHGWP